MTKTIYLDVDGVILDTEPAIREEIAQLTVHSLPKPADTYHLGDTYGVSTQLVERAIRQAWSRPVPVFQDARDFIHQTDKHRIIGLSVRPGTGAMAARRDLLVVALDGLITVNSPADKWDIIGEDTVYVDDNPCYAATAGYNPKIQVYLRHQPYNQNCLDLGNYKRITSLLDLREEPWFVV